MLIYFSNDYVTVGVQCRLFAKWLTSLCLMRYLQVDFIKTEIRRFTEQGIETTSGEHRHYDVVVCATGFDTSFIPRFPVLGRGGLNLQDLWADHSKTYLGLCQDGFPNWYVFEILHEFLR